LHIEEENKNQQQQEEVKNLLWKLILHRRDLENWRKNTTICSRDKNKLSEILKVKQKEYEKATDSEDIETLTQEIEILTFVLVSRT